MFKYLKRNRQARFLIYGVIFTVIGFVLENMGKDFSKYTFWIAIIFLGYYASKEAVIETVKTRSPNVDLLMVLAALGAVLIDYHSEGAILLLIFAGAEVLEDFVTSKSSAAIKELMKQVPELAKRVLEDGNIEIISTDDLKIGDIVLVAKGDQIPIDGICDKSVLVEESSITGESIPVRKHANSQVFAGTINQGDSFKIEVNKEKKDTLFSNIVKMVEEAQNSPSKKEKIIEKIESKYTLSIIVIVPIFIAVLYYLNDYSFKDAFYRGMVLLTVASPCALVASATPAVLSSISNGAKNGILFKDARALEALSEIDIVMTDKTGTLTYGEFEVIEYECPKDILKQVVYIEQSSNHPIAQAIYNRFKDMDFSEVKVSEIREFEGSGLMMGDVIIGKKSIFAEYLDPNGYLAIDSDTNSISFVSKGNEVVGYFILSDKVRESASLTIESFRKENVVFEMLTGDNKNVAAKVSSLVGIKNYYYDCMPQDKVAQINQRKNEHKKVLMIGDGINDAPALANADISVAMGSGSSIALETSDVVVVKNDLSKIYFSYKLSQRLRKIIMQNIIFSVSVIALLIILNITGILDLPSGVVFHESSTILVILNSLRLLYFKTTN